MKQGLNWLWIGVRGWVFLLAAVALANDDTQAGTPSTPSEAGESIWMDDGDAVIETIYRFDPEEGTWEPTMPKNDE